MQMKKTFLTAALAALLGSHAAFGAIGLSNPGQQGSLLIFPRIAVQDGNATIIRIANNSEFPVRLKCYWVEQGAENISEQFVEYPDFKELRDFAFDLTRNQSIWFNARNGFGSISVSAFPAEFGHNGELICWATNLIESVERKFDFLSGTAEVVNTETGDTYKYSAYSFFRNTQAALVDGMLELDFDINNIPESQYDSCSEFLVSNFAPQGASVQVDSVAYNTERNILSWSGCDQDLTFATGKAAWIDYDVTFEVWNSDEIKRTGAFERGDSTWEVDLAELDRNGLYFTFSGLGTNTGYFRAREDSGRGMLGVLVTTVSVGEGPSYTHATTTVGAGRAEGVIMYEPGRPFPAASD